MKKNSFLKELSLMAIILSVLLFVAGCTKPDNPPAPTPVAPVITLSGVTTDTLNYGDSTSFSWSVTGKDVTVVLNGKAVKTNETYSTGRLFANKDYKLFAINAGGTVDSSFTIKVGDWTTSVYGIISHKHWIFGSISEKSVLTNNEWVVSSKDNTAPGFYTEAYYFLPNGIWQTRVRATNKIKSSGHWDVRGDSLIYKEGSHALILQAKKDTLSLETSNYVTDVYGKNLVYGRLIYIRENSVSRK